MLRSYDAQIGRFLQHDPYDQFASGYVGMGNDPGNMVDPTGGQAGPGFFTSAFGPKVSASGLKEITVVFHKLKPPTQLASQILQAASAAANVVRTVPVILIVVNEASTPPIKISEGKAPISGPVISAAPQMNEVERQQHERNKAKWYDDAGYLPDGNANM